MYCPSNIIFMYILSSVCLRLSQFSQWNIWGCVYSAYPFLLWCLRYVYFDNIIIIKLEVWPVCNYLWLGHEPIVCTVCLPAFFLSLVIYGTGTSFITTNGVPISDEYISRYLKQQAEHVIRETTKKVSVPIEGIRSISKICYSSLDCCV